ANLLDRRGGVRGHPGNSAHCGDVMMKRVLAMMLCLSLWLLPLGAADVKVPESVTVKQHRLARIVVETKGKTVEVINLWPDTDVFREYDPDRFVFRFYADNPGSFKLAFYSPDATPSSPAYCTVVVEGPPGPTPP